MKAIKFSESDHIYLVGIGGSGMSPLAKIFLEKGYRVSGADLKDSIHTIRLKDLGATVFYEHHERNLCGVDYVVCSGAISETNPERVAAEKQGIPV